MVIHLLVTMWATELFGVEGAIGAFFVSPLLFGIVLLFVGGEGSTGHLAREMTGDALRFLLLAAAAFGAAEIVADAVADGLAGSLLAGLLGSALYVTGMLLVARRQLRVVVRTLRPAAQTGT
jgi:hypothetical protein